MEKRHPLELLHAIEQILIQHRAFGDSGYIHEQLRVCAKRRLNKISVHLPVAAQLLEALCRADGYSQDRVIGDTVVRSAIEHALTQVETGTQYGLSLDQCEEVFRATCRHLEERQYGGPLETGFIQVNRLGPEPDAVCVWNEEHSNDIFGRSFRQVMQLNYGESLCTPSQSELKMLRKGAQLIRELLPLLSQSALSHVHLIALFPMVGIWKEKGSSSCFTVGGTIFLNRELLQSPWWVAEQLLHEFLHHKLYDFRHGHSLLEPHHSKVDIPRICSLWNASGLK